jgi:hypothetical protein
MRPFVLTRQRLAVGHEKFWFGEEPCGPSHDAPVKIKDAGERCRQVGVG